MNAARWDRLAAPAGGVIFVVLAVITSAIFSPPAPTKPAAKIASYFVRHHTAGKASAILSAISIIFALWFFGGLAMRLWAVRERRLAVIGFGGALITGATALAGTIIQGALVHLAIVEGDAATTKALYDVMAVTFVLIWAPLVATAASTAIASLRSAAFPRWYAYASGATALILLSGTATLANQGFYSPAHAWNFVALIVFLVWVLLTSFVLWRAVPPVEEVPI